MRKTAVLLGLVVLLVLGVTYVYAQTPGSDPGHKGMHECMGPGKEHSLTPEQKAKIQELCRNFRKENAKLIGAIVTKKLELESLWTDPKSDSKAILDKERELRDLRNQLKDKAVLMRLEVQKLLTPEQIQNWRPGRGMCGCHGMAGRGHMMGAGHEMGPEMSH
jgi:Spy/CpxP family protein refolding chaperone